MKPGQLTFIQLFIAYYYVGLATLKYRSLEMKVYRCVLISPYLSPGPS